MAYSSRAAQESVIRLPTQIVGRPLETDAVKAARYAKLTDDGNRVHLDAEFAAGTPFGVPIIHGTMALNLLMELVEDAFGESLGGFRVEVRFVKPVPVGSTIKAGGRLVDRAAGVYEVFVECESGLRALEGTLWIPPRQEAAQAKPAPP